MNSTWEPARPVLTTEYIRKCARDEIIFAEGDIGQHLYVVASGTVVITRDLHGRPVEIARLGHGEFFGEMAVIEEAPRLATARAGEDGTAVAPINQAQFIYLVSHQPVFALMVLEALSRRLRETTQLRFEAARPLPAVSPP